MTQSEFYLACGTWFSKGTLKIATEKKVIVIRPWGERAGAWCKTSESNAWFVIRPPICFSSRLAQPSREHFFELVRTPDGIVMKHQLLLPFKANAEAQAWKQCFNCIPPEALTLVRRFPNRHWHVLQCLNRVGSAAVDLAKDCPILLFLIANNFVFGKRTRHVQRISRRLCSIQRRKAADWLGFPDRNATINMFRKVPYGSISIPFCFYLRNCVNYRETAKMLLHAPRINAGVIRILAPDLALYTTPQLLWQVGLDKSNDRRPRASYLLMDVLRIMKLLRPDLDNKLRIRSISQLQELHDEWVDKLNQAGYDLFESFYLHLEFPKPPDLWYPKGNRLTIEPITNPKDLVDLGKRENHCIASWGYRVARGECVVCKVETAFETATLAIYKDRSSGNWEIMDMKAKSNEEVSSNTNELVRKWLAYAQEYHSTLIPQDFYDDDIPF